MILTNQASNNRVQYFSGLSNSENLYFISFNNNVYYLVYRYTETDIKICTYVFGFGLFHSDAGFIFRTVILETTGDLGFSPGA